MIQFANKIRRRTAGKRGEKMCGLFGEHRSSLCSFENTWWAKFMVRKLGQKLRCSKQRFTGGLGSLHGAVPSYLSKFVLSSSSAQCPNKTLTISESCWPSTKRRRWDSYTVCSCGDLEKTLLGLRVLPFSAGCRSHMQRPKMEDLQVAWSGPHPEDTPAREESETTNLTSADPENNGRHTFESKTCFARWIGTKVPLHNKTTSDRKMGLYWYFCSLRLLFLGSYFSNLCSCTCWAQPSTCGGNCEVLASYLPEVLTIKTGQAKPTSCGPGFQKLLQFSVTLPLILGKV